MMSVLPSVTQNSPTTSPAPVLEETFPATHRTKRRFDQMVQRETFPATHRTSRSFHQIDPNVVYNDETQTPGLLVTALLLQKWSTLRFIIDSRTVREITPRTNPTALDTFTKSFMESQKADGVNVNENDARLFLRARILPNMPTVFRDGNFHPLCQTPFSAAAKPLALFFIANDWSSPKSYIISKLFGNPYLPLYARIAQYFTVVRILVDHQDSLYPMIEYVKALLPGVPLVFLSINGHGLKDSVTLGTRLLMTFSDVKEAFEEEVVTLLSQTEGMDETRVRRELLAGMASGQKRCKRQHHSLTTANTSVMSCVSSHIAHGGKLALQSCSSAAGGGNLARAFSFCAPGITVLGPSGSACNIIPKVFFSSDGTPQLLPLFIAKKDPGLCKMLLKAYKDGELRANVSRDFTGPAALCFTRPGDIDRTPFTGIAMTEEENSDPEWQQLIQAIEEQDALPFKGGVNILAPTGSSSHEGKVPECVSL